MLLCGSVVAPAPLDSPQRHKEHRGGTEKSKLALRQKGYCYCERPAYNRGAQSSSSPAALTTIQKLNAENCAVYKPNFCCECGNKLVRLRWHFWTSRRFCNLCARRFRRERFVPLLLISLALITLGYLLGRTRQAAAPPLVIERRSDSPLSNSQSAGRQLTSTPGTTATSAANTIEADVYICGARTKKGTPCSRRVHGPVRCWQHKGMPAMLPQERLLIKD